MNPDNRLEYRIVEDVSEISLEKKLNDLAEVGFMIQCIIPGIEGFSRAKIIMWRYSGEGNGPRNTN